MSETSSECRAYNGIYNRRQSAWRFRKVVGQQQCSKWKFRSASTFCLGQSRPVSLKLCWRFQGFCKHVFFLLKLTNEILIIFAVFISLSIVVHNRHWVYCQCQSPIISSFSTNALKYHFCKSLRFKIFILCSHTIMLRWKFRFNHNGSTDVKEFEDQMWQGALSPKANMGHVETRQWRGGQKIIPAIFQLEMFSR
jgi:hypothetical protein